MAAPSAMVPLDVVAVWVQAELASWVRDLNIMHLFLLSDETALEGDGPLRYFKEKSGEGAAGAAGVLGGDASASVLAPVILEAGAQRLEAARIMGECVAGHISLKKRLALRVRVDGIVQRNGGAHPRYTQPSGGAGGMQTLNDTSLPHANITHNNPNQSTSLGGTIAGPVGGGHDLLNTSAALANRSHLPATPATAARPGASQNPHLSACLSQQDAGTGQSVLYDTSTTTATAPGSKRHATIGSVWGSAASGAGGGAGGGAALPEEMAQSIVSALKGSSRQQLQDASSLLHQSGAASAAATTRYPAGTGTGEYSSQHTARGHHDPNGHDMSAMDASWASSPAAHAGHVPPQQASYNSANSHNQGSAGRSGSSNGHAAGEVWASREPPPPPPPPHRVAPQILRDRGTPMRRASAPVGGGARGTLRDAGTALTDASAATPGTDLSHAAFLEALEGVRVGSGSGTDTGGGGGGGANPPTTLGSPTSLPSDVATAAAELLGLDGAGLVWPPPAGRGGSSHAAPDDHMPPPQKPLQRESHRQRHSSSTGSNHGHERGNDNARGGGSENAVQLFQQDSNQMRMRVSGSGGGGGHAPGTSSGGGAPARASAASSEVSTSTSTTGSTSTRTGSGSRASTHDRGGSGSHHPTPSGAYAPPPPPSASSTLPPRQTTAHDTAAADGVAAEDEASSTAGAVSIHSALGGAGSAPAAAPPPPALQRASTAPVARWGEGAPAALGDNVAAAAAAAAAALEPRDPRAPPWRYASGVAGAVRGEVGERPDHNHHHHHHLAAAHYEDVADPGDAGGSSRSGRGDARRKEKKEKKERKKKTRGDGDGAAVDDVFGGVRDPHGGCADAVAAGHRRASDPRMPMPEGLLRAPQVSETRHVAAEGGGEGRGEAGLTLRPPSILSTTSAVTTTNSGGAGADAAPGLKAASPCRPLDPKTLFAGQDDDPRKGTGTRDSHHPHHPARTSSGGGGGSSSSATEDTDNDDDDDDDDDDGGGGGGGADVSPCSTSASPGVAGRGQGQAHVHRPHPGFMAAPPRASPMSSLSASVTPTLDASRQRAAAGGHHDYLYQHQHHQHTPVSPAVPSPAYSTSSAAPIGLSELSYCRDDASATPMAAAPPPAAALATAMSTLRPPSYPVAVPSSPSAGSGDTQDLLQDAWVAQALRGD